MIQSGLIERPISLHRSCPNLATCAKQAACLSNDFAQETPQVCPKFLKAECYLLGTCIISLTIFGQPSIVVLGFLFSLFIPMGAGGLFKFPTPSFPPLSLSGAIDLKRLGEAVESWTWHIEMRLRRRVSHQCRRRHEECGYVGRR